jgi:NTP pyrophosphatase (non-canonical NTP hydrolase)
MSSADERRIEELSFRQYQDAALETDQVPVSREDNDRALMVPLLGLAGEAGSLLSEFKKWMRQGEIYRPFPHQVSEEIGDILWYISNIASKMDLDLEEIARENLAKLEDRWGKSGTPQAELFGKHHRRYDEHYPEHEQLPRPMRAEFRMVTENGRRKLAVSLDGKQFGDSLTDNSHFDDGYRFHDCFHITLAILFGWSPIIRRQLQRKRKSVPEIDEVEDGARAAITEEAISVVVYGFAKDFTMFDGAAEIEYDLLRTIKLMTRQLEVHDRTPHEWQTAILQAYAVWRKLIENDGGILIGDSEKRSVHYEAFN